MKFAVQKLKMRTAGMWVIVLGDRGNLYASPRFQTLPEVIRLHLKCFVFLGSPKIFWQFVGSVNCYKNWSKETVGIKLQQGIQTKLQREFVPFKKNKLSDEFVIFCLQIYSYGILLEMLQTNSLIIGGFHLVTFTLFYGSPSFHCIHMNF